MWVQQRSIAVFLWCAAIASVPGALLAQGYTSTSYTVETPTIVPGGYATSTSFGLQSILMEIGVGTSSSTTYGNNASFPFYPQVSTPVVSATAGATQVALSWSASQGYLGWTVGGYAVGQSTTNGGPYSFTNVGNVTSSTRTGLTAGTTYYFVIRVLDGLGNTIATSTQASATPTAASGGSGGGGGSSSGGGGSTGTTGGSIVNFSGRAFPRRTITFLKDAQVAGTTIAGADARFTLSIGNVAAGNYIFSVYSEDTYGNRSSLLTFPVGVTANTMTDVTGIFLAPTISTDLEQVKKGDNIAIFGQAQADANITITVHSEEEIYAQVKSDANGVYLYTLDTQPLELGDHTAKSKSALLTEISSFSSAATFKVGTENVSKTKKDACTVRGDVNTDCKVNLVDFSIVAYWYKRANPPAHVDINADKKIDLIDFSIMAFNWTG